MIEGHGNDIHRFPGLVRADFSSNVASREVPAPLLEFLSSQLHTVANYPEPDSETLRKSIAARHGLNSGNIVVTNGSTEAFYTIACAFRQSLSMVFIPSFAEYEDACHMHDHALFLVDNAHFEDDFEMIPGMVWLGNPNNPDGRLLSSEAIREKLIRYPKTVFVVDEAYGELCRGFESVVPLLKTFHNLIVVHSMTKLYSIPGLRLGYILTGGSLAVKLKEYRMPCSVNALAQQVGLFLTQHEEDIKLNAQELVRGALTMQQNLSLLPGLEVIPSPCTFFLFRLLSGKATRLKDLLLKNHGLLVRDASNFRGLDDRYLRIAAQSEPENELLIEALQKYLTQL